MSKYWLYCDGDCGGMKELLMRWFNKMDYKYYVFGWVVVLFSLVGVVFVDIDEGWQI